MSRQNSNSPRDSKHEDRKHERISNGQRDRRADPRSVEEDDRDDQSQISGLDANRLNDLYERSSI